MSKQPLSPPPTAAGSVYNVGPCPAIFQTIPPPGLLVSITLYRATKMDSGYWFFSVFFPEIPRIGDQSKNKIRLTYINLLDNYFVLM